MGRAVRKLWPVILMAGCVASGPLAPDAYEAGVVAALRDGGCRFEGGSREDEARFAARISPHLGLSADDLLDRDGPHFDGVDDAIERLADNGSIILDEERRVATLMNCTA